MATVATNLTAGVTPGSLRDTPTLIERLWPAQKISRESEAERKSVAGQTLTGLGGYWKGRKPLILNRACILGALLPATADAAKDLEVFERLMMIDDRGFVERCKSRRAHEYAAIALDHRVYTPVELAKFFAVRDRVSGTGATKVISYRTLDRLDSEVLAEFGREIVWHPSIQTSFHNVAARILSHVPYDTKIDESVRPEYLETTDPYAHAYMWDVVNGHLGMRISVQ